MQLKDYRELAIQFYGEEHIRTVDTLSEQDQLWVYTNPAATALMLCEGASFEFAQEVAACTNGFSDIAAVDGNLEREQADLVYAACMAAIGYAIALATA